MSASLADCLVVDLLALMDHSLEIENVPFSKNKHSNLSTIETGAPLRSVCPDKEARYTPAFNKN